MDRIQSKEARFMWHLKHSAGWNPVGPTIKLYINSLNVGCEFSIYNLKIDL